MCVCSVLLNEFPPWSLRVRYINLGGERGGMEERGGREEGGLVMEKISKMGPADTCQI